MSPAKNKIDLFIIRMNLNLFVAKNIQKAKKSVANLKSHGGKYFKQISLTLIKYTHLNILLYCN